MKGYTSATREILSLCLEPILLPTVHNNKSDSVPLNNLSFHNGRAGALHPESGVKKMKLPQMYNPICLYLSSGDSGTTCIDHITQRCNIPLNFKSNQIFTETDWYLRKRKDTFHRDISGMLWVLGFIPATVAPGWIIKSARSIAEKGFVVELRITSVVCIPSTWAEAFRLPCSKPLQCCASTCNPPLNIQSMSAGEKAWLSGPELNCGRKSIH